MVKPSSCGAARRPRSRAVSFANGGDASPTPRSIRSARPTRRSRWSHPEHRLSQPTIRATAFFERRLGRRVRAHGHRAPAAPRQRRPLRLRRRDSRRRWIAAAWATRRSPCASRAPQPTSTGRRMSSAASAGGRRSCRGSRPTRGSAAIDAVYTEILQVGGELETTRADWRFFAEGFGRRGARRRDRAGTDLRLRGRRRRIPAPGRVRRRATTSFRGSSSWPTRAGTAPTFRSPPRCAPACGSRRPGSSPRRSRSATSTTGPSAATGSSASVEKTLAESPTVNRRVPVHGILRREQAERARYLGGRPRAVRLRARGAVAVRRWRRLVRGPPRAHRWLPHAIVAIDVALIADACRPSLSRRRRSSTTRSTSGSIARIRPSRP